MFVLRMAFVSRCITLGLMLIQDAIFRDLSTSSHLQYYPCHDSVDSEGPVTSWISNGIESSIPWDGVYFMRIAQCGYESDQIFAFFPLLPAIMRGCGEVFRVMYRILLHQDASMEHMRLVFGLAGFGVNMMAFCGAALCLYRLGNMVVKDKDVVALSVLLFCFNPASVFYSAVYTESLFAFCTWMGLIRVLESQRTYWGGVFWFALASSLRSNGILAIWFLVYEWMRNMPLSNQRLVYFAKTLIGSGIVCIPYLGMQAYGYISFCRQGHESPEWCDSGLPSIYGYVQNKYWEVGFLNFYEKLVRLPFVVQSLPVIALSVAACWTWTYASLKRACSLGFVSLQPDEIRNIRSRVKHSCCIIEPRVGPFVYHLALMTAVATLVMHVNVATRFLSSNPLIFWYAAQRILNGSYSQSFLIWLWFLSYILIGTLMFGNFYPWT